MDIGIIPRRSPSEIWLSATRARHHRIIGFPGETQHSMEQTLKQAAHTKFLHLLAGSDFCPYRPIPGNLFGGPRYLLSLR